MTAVAFLEYLHRHDATRGLAEELAAVLVLRRRVDLVPSSVEPADWCRIAS